MNCDNCRFANVVRALPLSLECRRHAPRESADTLDNGRAVPIFPMVEPDDWCGDFEKRTNEREVWPRPF